MTHFSIPNALGPLRVFRSCSHTVYGYMWISPRMVNVGIRSQSFRIGGGRSKIYLLSVFVIFLWRDPCMTMFGSSQWSNCQIFLKFYEKHDMGKHKSIVTHSRKTSARAEDPIITASTRRWHWRDVRYNYFWEHKCLIKSLKHFQTDNFDLFRIPSLPQLPYRSDSSG